MANKKSNADNWVSATATNDTVKKSLLTLSNRFTPLQDLNENSDPTSNDSTDILTGCSNITHCGTVQNVKNSLVSSLNCNEDNDHKLPKILISGVQSM